jgi:glycosyltransferase involved in cell wall biosynthesis
MPEHPKLSVAIITFNHAEFIAKALDSVLMQLTSFDYEIIVGDDCSTDGTREIIQTYQQRWPAKITTVFREKNVGMMRNFKETVEQCTGNYIALLEGDDYWTDLNKLQLQAEYLDGHPNCCALPPSSGAHSLAERKKVSRVSSIEVSHCPGKWTKSRDVQLYSNLLSGLSTEMASTDGRAVSGTKAWRLAHFCPSGAARIDRLP